MVAMMWAERCVGRRGRSERGGCWRGGAMMGMEGEKGVCMQK